jgi:ribulose-5-phosphate 4-epimerase/fuculose-1-phosphate aldolase
VKISELVEKMAKIYWGALQIGEPNIIPEEVSLRLIKDFKAGFSTR